MLSVLRNISETFLVSVQIIQHENLFILNYSSVQKICSKYLCFLSKTIFSYGFKAHDDFTSLFKEPNQLILNNFFVSLNLMLHKNNEISAIKKSRTEKFFIFSIKYMF